MNEFADGSSYFGSISALFLEEVQCRDHRCFHSQFIYQHLSTMELLSADQMAQLETFVLEFF